MAISANTLFHFSKKKENLKGILKNYFHPKYSLEDLSNVIPEGKIYAANIPMVCFCDLIFPQIKDHINFYGDYGIGLRKKGWGIKKGISPIVYVPKDSISANLIQLLGANISTLLKSKDGNETIHKQLPDFFKYIKAYDGIVLNRKNRKMEDRIFYDEREWRYVPKGFSVLPENLANPNIIEDENLKMSIKKRLTFKAIDVKYIIVKKESEIPEFFNFIERDLKGIFSDSERQLLMSKLISVQQIKDDM